MRRRALLVAGLTALLGGSSLIPTEAAVEPPQPPGGLDVRADAAGIAPTAAQGDAIARLVAARPGTVVRWNRAFGTPATVVREGAALTDGADGSADAVAAV